MLRALTTRLFPVLLLAVAGGTASADPYATVRLGYADADLSLDAPYNGSIDDQGPAYGVNLGYRLSDLLAVELGATRFDDLDGRATPCPTGQICTLVIRDVPDNEVDTWSASLLPSLRMGDVALFGRAGYYRAEIDTRIPFANNEFTGDGWLLGGGARWRFSDTWSLALEASAYEDRLSQVGVTVGWHPGGFGN